MTDCDDSGIVVAAAQVEGDEADKQLNQNQLKNQDGNQRQSQIDQLP